MQDSKIRAYMEKMIALSFLLSLSAYLLWTGVEGKININGSLTFEFGYLFIYLFVKVP